MFTGFLLTDDGPKLLEYNVRFGDPETEALMLLLSDDTDLAQVLLVRLQILFWPPCLEYLTLPQACAEHRLDSVTISTKQGVAVSVVLASEGYPNSYPKGRTITLPSELPLSKKPGASADVVIFHAGELSARQMGVDQ